MNAIEIKQYISNVFRNAEEEIANTLGIDGKIVADFNNKTHKQEELKQMIKYTIEITKQEVVKTPNPEFNKEKPPGEDNQEFLFTTTNIAINIYNEYEPHYSLENIQDEVLKRICQFYANEDRPVVRLNVDIEPVAPYEPLRFVKIKKSDTEGCVLCRRAKEPTEHFTWKALSIEIC